ncbi:MAG: hypothetical protein CMI17_03875 [Opitutaceae bacterium]|nr:hypothetical protein [Opitutaceae bacterium]
MKFTVDQFPVFLERIVDELSLSAGSFHWIEGSEMPVPYRDLVVHNKDMTSTLADLHSSGIGLEVLNETNERSGHVREVVLFADPTGKPVEYGAIRIQLDHFRPEVSKAIVEGKELRGSTLNRMQYTYASRPKGFFLIQAPLVCQKRFGCSEDSLLYGRYNQLFNNEENETASFIEILPLV